MPRITVVNDNPEFLELVREILEGDRYETTTIDGDQVQALEAVRASHPDVLMIDLRMGSDELHGWALAQRVRADPELQGLPILLCSADVRALHSLEKDLEHDRNVRTLIKPFPIDALTEAVDGLVAATAQQ